MAELEWNGPEAKRRGERALVNFLYAASINVEDRAKQLLSVPGTGRNRRDVRGRYLKAAKGIVHSPPGEPPYKQTGRLRASVIREVDENEFKARVGTNLEYGKHLEFGTSQGLLPRPWLRRALAESRAKISDIAARLGVHFT